MKSLALFCAVLAIAIQFSACASAEKKDHCCTKPSDGKTCTHGSCKVK